MSPIFIVLIIVGVASALSPILPEPIRDCGPYAAWRECGTSCPTSCDNYKSSDTLICPAVCRSGCVCIDGRIKKSGTSMECVLPEECQQ
ncbi:chymotrypsin inhibitor-like [Belonocnema kinseyi]|uniref:chymotrypsin inhibitor-like n=1 Tax=Belonocnema kinseyi TaxID=2817044 RepID=UPI00143D38E3|nr:chymotrypsin inhibitor-like [Belonocnema kinseyi]